MDGDMVHLQRFVDRGDPGAAVVEAMRSRGILLDLVLCALAAKESPEWLIERIRKDMSEVPLRSA